MENKKLWYATRILFYSIITFWILALTPLTESFVYSILWIGLSIATFVCSIVHLVKYEKKAFAITALVISSILNIMFFIGFMIGVMTAI